MSDEILTTKQNLTEAVQQLIADATAELRRELEQARKERAGFMKDCKTLLDQRDDLRAQLETARQEIEGLNGQLGAMAHSHVMNNGRMANEADRLKADRDKALRVAEDLQRRYDLLDASEKKLAGELRVSQAGREVCRTEMLTARDERDKAQSDLSACRALLGEAVEVIVDFAGRAVPLPDAAVGKIEKVLTRYTALKAGQQVWGDKDRLDWLESNVMASETVARGWKLFFYSKHHDDIRTAIDAAAKQEEK